MKADLVFGFMRCPPVHITVPKCQIEWHALFALPVNNFTDTDKYCITHWHGSIEDDGVRQWKSEKFDPAPPKKPEPIVTKICMGD